MPPSHTEHATKNDIERLDDRIDKTEARVQSTENLTRRLELAITTHVTECVLLRQENECTTAMVRKLYTKYTWASGAIAVLIACASLLGYFVTSAVAEAAAAKVLVELRRLKDL